MAGENSHCVMANSTVFIISNLDTHLAVVVSAEDTVGDLKSKIRSLHRFCFPDIGDITVHALKVKHEPFLFHLPDSMLVGNAFDKMDGTWFLHMDAAPACSTRNRVAEKALRADLHCQNRHLLCLDAETNDLQAHSDNQHSPGFVDRVVSEALNLVPKDPSAELGKCASDNEKMLEFVMQENHDLVNAGDCVSGEHGEIKNDNALDVEDKEASCKERWIDCDNDGKENESLVPIKTNKAEKRSRYGDNLSEFEEELGDLLKPVIVGKRRRKKGKQGAWALPVEGVLSMDSSEAKNRTKVVTSEGLPSKALVVDQSLAGAGVNKKKKRKSLNRSNEVEPKISCRTAQRSSSPGNDENKHREKPNPMKCHVTSSEKSENQENSQSDAGKESNAEATSKKKASDTHAALEEVPRSGTLCRDPVKEAVDGESIKYSLPCGSPDVDIDKFSNKSKIDASKQATHSRGKKVKKSKRTRAATTKSVAPPSAKEPVNKMVRATSSSVKNISPDDTQNGEPKVMASEEPNPTSPLLGSLNQEAKNNRNDTDPFQFSQSVGVIEAEGISDKKTKKSKKTRTVAALVNDGAGCVMLLKHDPYSFDGDEITTNNREKILSQIAKTNTSEISNLTTQLWVSKEGADKKSRGTDSLQFPQSVGTGETVDVRDKKSKRKLKNPRATSAQSFSEPLIKQPDEQNAIGNGKDLEILQGESKNQLLGSVTEVEEDSRPKIEQVQQNLSNGFESNMEGGSIEAKARDSENVTEIREFKDNGINFIEYFTPTVTRYKPVDPKEKIETKEIQKRNVTIKKRNKRTLQKLGAMEIQNSPKENGAAKVTISASTECSEGSRYKSKPSKQLRSVDHYWVSVRKTLAKTSRKTPNDSNQKKSLLASSDPIFSNVSGESSEGQYEGNESKATSQSLSDNSSSSVYSDGEQEKANLKTTALKGPTHLCAPGNGILQNEENAGNHEVQAKYKDSSTRSVSLNQILKSSSRYRKAQQKASQSELEDIEDSQPVDIVLETQASQAELVPCKEGMLRHINI